MFPRVTHPSATPPHRGVRLACVKPAASVRSEPGSNSQVVKQPRFRTQLSHSSKARPLGPASRRVPKHIRQPPQKKTNTMNFENVTVGEVLLLRFRTVLASQRTARTPPSTFLFLPMKLSNSVESRSSPETSSPTHRQTREDDNTPGKPCRAITTKPKLGSVETRGPLISSAAVDDRDIRDQPQPRQCPLPKKTSPTKPKQQTHPPTPQKPPSVFADGGHRRTG